MVYDSLFIKAEGIKPGQKTVVFGCGPIGLFGISQLKAAGASRVIAFELNKTRREIALKMGADAVFDPSELSRNNTKIEEVILEQTKGHGADLFLESSGAT